MSSLVELITAGNELSGSTVVLLVVICGVTAFITAAAGIGGGVLLLAVMATALPAAALIPVHGLVQFGANATRGVMLLRHLDLRMFVYFSAGALPGAIIASMVIVQLPTAIIQVAVAGFILLLVWGNKPRRRETTPYGRAAAGLFTTFLSMFVGATGPLVAAFVHRNGYSKLQLSATFATCMSFQHSVKVIIFILAGFQFSVWLPLVLAMGIASVTGTWVGLKALVHISDFWFQEGFKIIITLLALRLLWQAAGALTG